MQTHNMNIIYCGLRLNAHSWYRHKNSRSNHNNDMLQVLILPKMVLISNTQQASNLDLLRFQIIYMYKSGKLLY